MPWGGGGGGRPILCLFYHPFFRSREAKGNKCELLTLDSSSTNNAFTLSTSNYEEFLVLKNLQRKLII
jgi:hypothetical protein